MHTTSLGSIPVDIVQDYNLVQDVEGAVVLLIKHLNCVFYYHKVLKPINKKMYKIYYITSIHNP